MLEIKVDQVGYLPSRAKLAIVTDPRATGSFTVRRAADGSEALWFQFAPNKDGPEGTVYISPGWEDLVTYCVEELIAYGDRVRSLARPSEESGAAPLAGARSSAPA